MKIIEEELSKNMNLKIPPSYISQEKPQIEIPPSQAIEEKPQTEIQTRKNKDFQNFFQEAKPDDLVSVKEKDEKYLLFKKKLGLKSSNNSKHFTNLAKEFNSKLNNKQIPPH